MSESLTYVCFEPGSLGPADVLDMALRYDLGFEPKELSSSVSRRRVPLTAAAVDRLADSGHVDWLRVHGTDGRFSMTGIAGWPTQTLVCRTSGPPPHGLVEANATMIGFNAAMVGDADDVFWQSADQVNTYEVLGRPHEGLPKVWDEVNGREKIDISGNPGRKAPVPGMWLWAAADMWFGSRAFRVLDRQRLLAYPEPGVEETAEGTVRVHLYDLGAPVDTVRARQRSFRDWMGYDDIEERAPEMYQLVADPKVEFDTGSFDHGGVRKVTEWLDDSHDPTSRSAATVKRITELAADGTAVWTGLVPGSEH